MESFFEDWAKDLARTCEKAWTTSGKVTKPLAYLYATQKGGKEIRTPLSNPAAKDITQVFDDTSKRLFQKYYKRIKDNNGIKESNVLSLFDPLGVPASAWGSTLLPNLDSFGELRGEHAHRSAKAVVNLLDPETEYKRVTALAAELQSFDEWLVAYKRGIK